MQLTGGPLLRRRATRTGGAVIAIRGNRRAQEEAGRAANAGVGLGGDDGGGGEGEGEGGLHCESGGGERGSEASLEEGRRFCWVRAKLEIPFRPAGHHCVCACISR